MSPEQELEARVGSFGPWGPAFASAEEMQAAQEALESIDAEGNDLDAYLLRLAVDEEQRARQAYYDGDPKWADYWHTQAVSRVAAGAQGGR
jgi:hypothetical protein